MCAEKAHNARVSRRPRDCRENWPGRKAAAHCRRDRKRGRAASRSQLKEAIHGAVLAPKGLDEYTGEKLHWHLLSNYRNEDAKAGRHLHKAKFAFCQQWTTFAPATLRQLSESALGGLTTPKATCRRTISSNFAFGPKAARSAIALAHGKREPIVSRLGLWCRHCGVGILDSSLGFIVDGVREPSWDRCSDARLHV